MLRSINSSKIFLLTLLLVVGYNRIVAQQIKLSQLSKYEKRWVLFHPIAALKIKKNYSRIIEVYQQVKQQAELDTFENGGKLDAFRHTYVMASLVQKINSKKIRKLGIAHEKGNQLDFMKHKLEEGELADSISCEMDLLNNEIGIGIGKECKKQQCDQQALKSKVIEAIKSGKTFYLKRNTDGKYLTCTGELILPEKWKDTWNIPKW